MTNVPAYVRAQGEIRAEFAEIGGRTQVTRVHETGGYRLRFPASGPDCEAVIVNTGGGVAGGDRVDLAMTVGPGGRVTLTTPSAERIYRAEADPAEINLALGLGEAACLEWLPQETILFDGARLRRRLDIDMTATSCLTMVEAVVFGRMASGEVELRGSFRDRWRVRRERRLVFADETRLDGDVTGVLDRAAVGGGSRAMAILLHVAPHAELRVEPVRAALGEACSEWGVSAWNGFLVGRLVSPSPEKLRADILTVLQTLRGRDAPRVWQQARRTTS